MICVLVLGAGDAWEDHALSTVEAHPRLVVLRRCMDADDLVASATAGQAHVALVSLDAPGVDPATVDMLRRQGVRTVVVSHASPEEVSVRERVLRLGVAAALGAGDLSGLCDTLLQAEAQEQTVVRGAGAVHEPGAAPREGARTIAVWGPAGSPGRSTVALNVAAELARRSEPVLLIDADPYGGTLAQQLAILDETSGLLQIARLASSGMLAERLPSAARSIGGHLAVVTGLPRADRWREVRPLHLEQAIDIARGHGHVVLDTGFCLEDEPGGDIGGRPGRNALTRTALEMADAVVAVGTADPVGLARLARGLVDLTEEIGPAETRVLVNQMRPSIGWSESEVAGMVGAFVQVGGLHFAPYDRPAADAAALAGVPVVERDSSLAWALRGLVDALVPASVAASAPRRRRRAAQAAKSR